MLLLFLDVCRRWIRALACINLLEMFCLQSPATQGNSATVDRQSQPTPTSPSEPTVAHFSPSVSLTRRLSPTPHPSASVISQPPPTPVIAHSSLPLCLCASPVVSPSNPSASVSHQALLSASATRLSQPTPISSPPVYLRSMRLGLCADFLAFLLLMGLRPLQLYLSLGSKHQTLTKTVLSQCATNIVI